MSKLILKKNLKFKIQNYIILLLLIIVFINFVYKLNNNNYIEKFFNNENNTKMKDLDLFFSNRSITTFYNDPKSEKYINADNYRKKFTDLELLMPSLIKQYIIYKKKEIINKIKNKTKSKKYTEANFINDIYILAVAKEMFFNSISSYATYVVYKDRFININIKNEIQNAIENKDIYEIIKFNNITNSLNILYKHIMPPLNKNDPPVKYERIGYNENDIFDGDKIKDNILYDLVILQSNNYLNSSYCQINKDKDYCKNKAPYDKEKFNLQVKFYYTDLNLLFKLLAKYYERRNERDHNNFCEDTKINDMKKYNFYDSSVLKEKYETNFCYSSIMRALIQIIFYAFSRRLLYNMFSLYEQKNLLTTYNNLNPNFIAIINNTFGTTLI